VRTALAILTFIGAFIGSLAVAGLGGQSPAALAGALACLFAGFASLRIAGRVDVPARPLRLTVGITSVIGLAMLGGVGWPTNRADVGAALALVTSLALSIGAAAGVRRRPRAAILALSPVALNALWILVRFARAVTSTGPLDLGPSATLAFFVAGTAAAGWIVAPWHAWRVRAAGTNHAPPS
jgi:hypothetical protein